jgi:hypothetical protein
LRNSLNVALLVTANFIDPFRWRSSKLARLTRQGLPDRRKFMVAKGSQRHRINPVRRIGRQAITACPDTSKGMAPSMRPGEVLSLQAAAAPHRKLPAALQQTVKDCICLFLCLGGPVPISQSVLAKPGLSLATLSPNSFSGPFRSCCRLTHIEGVPRPRTVVFLTCVV